MGNLCGNPQVAHGDVTIRTVVVPAQVVPRPAAQQLLERPVAPAIPTTATSAVQEGIHPPRPTLAQVFCGYRAPSALPELHWVTLKAGWLDSTIRHLNEVERGKHQKAEADRRAEWDALPPAARRRNPWRARPFVRRWGAQTLDELVIELRNNECVVPELAIATDVSPLDMVSGLRALTSRWQEKVSGPVAGFDNLHAFLCQEYLRHMAIEGRNSLIMWANYQTPSFWGRLKLWLGYDPKINLLAERLAGNQITCSMIHTGQLLLARCGRKAANPRDFLVRELVTRYAPYVTGPVLHVVKTVVDFLLISEGLAGTAGF